MIISNDFFPVKKDKNKKGEHMPESPEVRIIAEQLNERVAGHFFSEFEVVGGRYRKSPDPSFGIIKNVLAAQPLLIKEVSCKGKFIYWVLDKEWYLWNTLGMTGGWSIDEPTKHPTIRMMIGCTNYYFNDVRHFGTIKFVPGTKQLQEKLNSLGPDILKSPPTEEEFFKLITRSSRTLAEWLMNQKNISGVGNYIKAEALYRAELSPWLQGQDLTYQESAKLLSSILAVVQESYAVQGTTLSNYKNLLGEKGGFSDKLQVYGKTKDPDGRTIIAETTPDKRTTWWVPSKQK